jgi:hypothetical protein
MKVGIIQSNYLPWRGYFDFINSVDIFVFHDDIQYTKGDWRNRNLIKTDNGLKWITVPVSYRKTEQLIDETPIDYSKRWAKKHFALIEQNYRSTAYYQLYINELKELLNHTYSSISDLNYSLAIWVMGILGIKTQLIRSRELNVIGSKTDRLINILQKLNATTYVSGPTAKAYIDVEKFKKYNMGLEYKTYDYPEYPQINGPFAGNVSIIDLLCNCGPDSKKYIQSKTPNEVVLP